MFKSNSRDSFIHNSATTNMEWTSVLVSLSFFCVFVCPASLRPASQDLFLPDLSPYNSVHGPEQIHIAYGDFASEMTIMWSTSSVQELSSSIVLYGLAPKNYSLKAEGKFALFTEGNPDGLQYVHRVVLKVSVIRDLNTLTFRILHCYTENKISSSSKSEMFSSQLSSIYNILRI